MAESIKDIVEELTEQLEKERAERAEAPDEFLQVKEFQRKFGLMCADNPRRITNQLLDERVRFITEELEEFKRAAWRQDLAGLADALVDIVYVAKGTAAMMGLPWATLWNDVHNANMRKVILDGGAGYKKKVGKPPGWVGPKTEAILEASNDGVSPSIAEDDKGSLHFIVKHTCPACNEMKAYPHGFVPHNINAGCEGIICLECLIDFAEELP
jgi:predicted HAD superfamily Cof-like phosphohydrolase